MRIPSKTDSLKFLKDNGIKAKYIVDVGVQHETRELKEVFADIRHYLFEPVVEYHSFIKNNYSAIDYVLVGKAVSESCGECALTVTRMGLETITHSSIEGSFSAGSSEVRAVDMITLDSYFSHQPEIENIILKIDVDGHEIAILNGASSLLKKCSAVVLESPLVYLHERLNYMLSCGFVLWDIVDFCYYRGNLHQVDMIFLSRNTKELPHFSPWQNFEFDWNAWREHSPR